MDAAWRRKRARFSRRRRARTHAKKVYARLRHSHRGTIQGHRSHEIGAGKVQPDRSTKRAKSACVSSSSNHDRCRFANVASEMMAEQPEPRVIAWLDSLEPEGLWLNAITVFEIKRGIDELDPGRRKRALALCFRRARASAISTIASFLSISPRRSMLRRSISTGSAAGDRLASRDTQIAGIAVSRGAAIATRNVRHFDDLSVEIDKPLGCVGLIGRRLTPAPCLPCRWPCRCPRR